MTKQHRAFSLIEAAIVLGVIGLVIGAVWAATDTVRQRNKANRVAQNILFMVSKARKIFPPSEYPAACCTGTNVTSTAISAGVVPKDWVAGSSMVTEYGRGGSQTGISLSHYTTYGQTMAIYIAGREGGYTTGMNQKDCQYLVAAFAAKFTNNSDFLYVQIVQTDNPHVFLYPPIALSSIACPADFITLNFWFRPT